MSVLRNLEQAYEVASAKYLSLMASLEDQGDDVMSYSVDGQSYTRHDVLSKLKELQETMRSLKEMIALEAGPYEIHSYGF
jgi:pyruvate formate-lyase activating enzyme-like uncharacterized protein